MTAAPGLPVASRFNRKRIALLLACLLAVLGGALIAALQPRPPRAPVTETPRPADRSGVPELLANLPRSYGDIMGASRAPAPSPAHRPVLEHRPVPEPRSGLDGLVSAARDPAEAERRRQLQQQQQARESSLFFSLTKAGQDLASQSSAADGAASQPANARGAPAPAAAAWPDDMSGHRLPETGQMMPGGFGTDTGWDPAQQQRKSAFVSQPADRQSRNPHQLQDAASPYQLLAGSVIAASLLTGINSGLPGLAKAQVTQPVYDTVSGRHLLIPQGSQLIGRYDSLVTPGQDRVLLVWQRLILPDGASLLLDAMPASDQAGYAGLADAVDHHTGRLAGGIALATLLGIGTALAMPDDEDAILRAIRNSGLRQTDRAGRRLVERNLDLQPTLTIRPGWPLRVVVHKDLVLRPWRS